MKQHPAEFMLWHKHGNWGEMSPEDKKLNDSAVRRGAERVFSAYSTGRGTKLWVITEWDRSETAILLLEVY